MSIFTQRNQRAICFAAGDINGTGITTAASKWIGVKNYSHLAFFLDIATHGAASTITVNKATTNAGAGSTPIAFNYRKTATADTDDFGALTAVASSGVATDGATLKQQYVVEVDCNELGDTYDFVQVIASNPGAAMVVALSCIGSESRHMSDSNPTMLS